MSNAPTYTADEMRLPPSGEADRHNSPGLLFAAMKELAVHYPDIRFRSAVYNAPDLLGTHGPEVRIFRGNEYLGILEVTRTGRHNSEPKWLFKGKRVPQGDRTCYGLPSVWRKKWPALRDLIMQEEYLRKDNAGELYVEAWKKLKEEMRDKLLEINAKAAFLVQELKKEAVAVAMGIGNSPETNALRGDVPNWVRLIDEVQSEFARLDHELAEGYGVNSRNAHIVDYMGDWYTNPLADIYKAFKKA